MFDAEKFGEELLLARELGEAKAIELLDTPYCSELKRAACFERVASSYEDFHLNPNLESLTIRLLGDLSLLVQKFAIMNCHKLCSRNPSDELWRMVRMGNANTYIALRELARMGDQSVFKECVIRINNGNHADKLECFMTLSIAKDSRALGILTRELQLCTDYLLLGPIAVAIARCGGKESVYALEYLSNCGSSQEQLPYVCELAKMKHPAGLNKLKLLIEDRDNLPVVALFSALKTSGITLDDA